MNEVRCLEYQGRKVSWEFARKNVKFCEDYVRFYIENKQQVDSLFKGGKIYPYQGNGETTKLLLSPYIASVPIKIGITGGSLYGMWGVDIQTQEVYFVTEVDTQAPTFEGGLYGYSGKDLYPVGSLGKIDAEGYACKDVLRMHLEEIYNQTNRTD